MSLKTCPSTFKIASDIYKINCVIVSNSYYHYTTRSEKTNTYRLNNAQGQGASITGRHALQVSPPAKPVRLASLPITPAQDTGQFDARSIRQPVNSTQIDTKSTRHGQVVTY